MSITTHTSTIRQYVKNHTKDDIALFFEHQFVAKDAEIERLKDGLKRIAEMYRPRTSANSLAQHILSGGTVEGWTE